MSKRIPKVTISSGIWWPSLCQVRDTLTTYGPSHDNAIVGNVSHTDGPDGNEKKVGVVPASLAGFVVLNRTYNKILKRDVANLNGSVWQRNSFQKIDPCIPHSSR